jgi:hypothetical protein
MFLALPTRWRQIKNLVPFLVSHVKGLLHLQDINLESMLHNRHGTILHNGTTICAFHFGEILYFSRISPMLIFVWFYTTWIVLSNDMWSSSIWVVRVEELPKKTNRWEIGKKKLKKWGRISRIFQKKPNELLSVPREAHRCHSAMKATIQCVINRRREAHHAFLQWTLHIRREGKKKVI